MTVTEGRTGTTSGARLPDPNVAPLGQWDRTIALIAEISGLPAGEVKVRLAREFETPGYNVRLDAQKWAFDRYQWNERLTNFYERSSAFLFESYVFNCSHGKQSMRRNVARLLARMSPTPLRVLVIGDGLGFDSAYLALAGHRVDYFEVSGPGQQFARAVFACNGVNVPQIPELEGTPPESYDAVVCLDVLEHLPDPKSAVEGLAKMLRRDGQFIVHAPFWYVADEVPTHLDSNRKYSGDWKRLYKPFGLYPVDSFSLWMPLVLKKSSATPALNLFRRLKISTVGSVLSLARFWNLPLVLAARLATKSRPVTGLPPTEV